MSVHKCRGAKQSPVNSKEFTDSADLFNDIDPLADKCSAKPQITTGPELADTNVDFESQLDSVVLNDWPEDEDDGDDSEDDGEEYGPDTEGEGDGVLEAMVIDARADEMDVDEEVEAPDPSLAIAAPFQAGCGWTRENWSCTYDVVFMVFFSIYQQSSPSWRSDWRQQSLEWALPLADRFNLLIKTLDSPEQSPKALSTLFSSLRDQFRDQLSNYNPNRFPRTGPVESSACAILELLFGSMQCMGRALNGGSPATIVERCHRNLTIFLISRCQSSEEIIAAGRTRDLLHQRL